MIRLSLHLLSPDNSSLLPATYVDDFFIPNGCMRPLPITSRGASRGLVDDHTGSESTLPGRLEVLSEVEREERALEPAERWRYDEDVRFPASEGTEVLERQLVDDYDAK